LRGKEISITKLAEISGISRPYLSQIESGKRKPTPEVLEKIADGLQALTGELITYSQLLEKAGYKELSIGQQYKEMINDFSEDPEQDLLQALGKLKKSIQANNIDQVQKEDGSISEHTVNEDNLYDLGRIFKQVSRPVMFESQTLTEDEKEILYDFVQLILNHRK